MRKRDDSHEAVTWQHYLEACWSQGYSLEFVTKASTTSGALAQTRSSVRK